MVDRGGLNYKISVKDDFTKTAKKFRAQLKLSKKEWTKFKRTQKGGRKQADALKQMADETARLATAQGKLSKAGGSTRPALATRPRRKNFGQASRSTPTTA